MMCPRKDISSLSNLMDITLSRNVQLVNGAEIVEQYPGLLSNISDFCAIRQITQTLRL